MRTSTLILIALGLLFTVQAATQDGAFIIDRSNTIVTLRHGGEWLSCPDLNCRWYRTNSVSEMEDRGWSVITNSQDLQNLDSMVAAGSQGNLFIGYRDLQSDNIPDLDANFPPFNSINSNPQAFAYYNLGGQEVTSGTDTSTGEVPPEAGAENDAPASSAGLPPINAPGASSSAPTQGTAMPNTAARDFIDAIFDGRVDNSIGPVIGKPGVFYTLDRAQEVYFKVDGDQITWLDPQTLAPTGVVTTLAAIEGAQGTIARYSATTTRTVGKGRNAVEFVLNFDPDASGSAAAIEFAQGMVTDVQEREGRLIVRIAADNGKAEYVYNANANRFERADGSGAVEMAQQGSTKYTVVTEYGANRASPQDDRVSITLPDGRILRGQAYSGGELRDGDRTIATFSANGRIETDFLDGNTNKPKTIYDPGHPNVVFAVRYDNKGKVMDMTGYGRVAGGERRVLWYAPEGETGDMWEYHYNERGEFTQLTGVGCEGGCDFERLKRLKEETCGGRPSANCEQINAILNNLKSNFWEAWDRMRRAAGAGAGICGILDMFSVSCGDSLFPAYDDFLQNTVIGNVISGETSALCTVWTDNPPSGGNVALGPSGFASAWIAGEAITIHDTAPAEYIYKTTFQINPSGIVEGECGDQKISVRVLLDGEPIDLNFDNQTNERDVIKLKCDKGGYSAMGSNAVVRYTEDDPAGKRICLEFDGEMNGFFESSLENGRLCNRLVPVEQAGDDFSCSFCLFGDTGFVEYENPQETNAVEEPAETGENRPQIENPR